MYTSVSFLVYGIKDVSKQTEASFQCGGDDEMEVVAKSPKQTTKQTRISKYVNI